MSSVKHIKNEESLDFATMFLILKDMLHITTQEEFASRLDIQAQAVSNAKNKGTMPIKWVHRLAQKNLVPWEKVAELMQHRSPPIEQDRPIPPPPSPPQEGASKMPLNLRDERRKKWALREAINKMVGSPTSTLLIRELMAGGRIDIHMAIVRQYMTNKGLLNSGEPP